MDGSEDEKWWQYDALEEWEDLHPRLRWLPRVLGWVLNFFLPPPWL